MERDDLIRVVEETPLLSDWGLADKNLCRRQGITPERFEQSRECLKKEVRGFQLCCQWLALYRGRKTINLRLGTSYLLKHYVESWSGEYVTNGVFIAAVIHMGIPFLARWDSPNIHVAISRKLVDGAKVDGPDKSRLVPGPKGPSAPPWLRKEQD